MAILKWFIDKFNTLISLLQDGKSNLSDALNSVSLAKSSEPDDFNASELSDVLQKISETIEMVDDIQRWIKYKKDKFEELEDKNRKYINIKKRNLE